MKIHLDTSPARVSRIAWHDCCAVKLLSAAVLFTLAGVPALTAADLPDIIWSTNAHAYGVRTVAFSGDSRFLASGSGDQLAFVWRTTNSASIRTLGDSDGVSAVSLSKDGTYAAMGGAGGRIQMWQVTDGSRLWQTLPSQVNVKPVSSVAFSHDGVKLVEARGFNDFNNNGEIVIHDALNGSGISMDGGDEEIPPVYSAAFSPDDSLVASGGTDRTAKLWQVPELSDQPPLRTFRGHSNTVNSVDFSPDGTLLATASTDGTARLWNVSNGELVRIIEGGGGTAKFSADGRLLFTLNNGTFKLWHVANGALAGSITNTGALVFDVAKNGKHFAYGRADGAVVLARMPTVLTKAEKLTNGFNFEWEGGSGLYQVQQTTSVTSAVWTNVGSPTAATNLAVPMTNSTAFFRVQSLTNGP